MFHQVHGNYIARHGEETECGDASLLFINAVRVVLTGIRYQEVNGHEEDECLNHDVGICKDIARLAGVLKLLHKGNVFLHSDEVLGDFCHDELNSRQRRGFNIKDVGGVVPQFKSLLGNRIRRRVEGQVEGRDCIPLPLQSFLQHDRLRFGENAGYLFLNIIEAQFVWFCGIHVGIIVSGFYSLSSFFGSPLSMAFMMLQR